MKNIVTNKVWQLAILLVFLSACSTTPSEQTLSPVSTVVTDETIVYTLEPSPLPTVVSTSSAQQTATISLTPSIIPNPTVTPESKVTFHRDCPLVVNDDTSILQVDGSVLIQKESEIWLISNESSSPTLIYTVPSEILSENRLWIYLATGTTWILSYYADPVDTTGYYVVYDLMNRQEIGEPNQLDHMIVDGWLPDGRFELLKNSESITDVGIKRELLIVDPVTQQTEIITDDLDLPGYQFFYEPFYSGLASLDPTDLMILYTLFDTAKETFSIALLERTTGTIIWQQEVDLPPYPYPEPQWEADGSRVLFSVFTFEGTNGYNKLISLTREGEEEELPPQPFPLTDEWLQIRSLSRSPNAQYIYYGLGEGSQKGPDIILDTVTLEAREICGPDAVFITGQWISENQFLYQVELPNGMLSLRILDVPAWTAQILIESEFSQFSWTPVEIP